MKKAVLIGFLSLLVTSISYAQEFETKIDNFIDSLQKAKIDTIATYEMVCHGEVFPWYSDEKICIVKQQKYIYWKYDNAYFYKRFDNCYNYPTYSLDTLNILHFYLQNKSEIDTEEILGPKSTKVEKVNNRKTIMTEQTITVSHSCHHMFDFFIEDETIKKDIDEFKISFKEFEDGKANENYEFNQKTKLIQLLSFINK